MPSVRAALHMPRCCPAWPVPCSGLHRRGKMTHMFKLVMASSKASATAAMPGAWDKMWRASLLCMLTQTQMLPALISLTAPCHLHQMSFHPW